MQTKHFAPPSHLCTPLLFAEQLEAIQRQLVEKALERLMDSRAAGAQDVTERNGTVEALSRARGRLVCLLLAQGTSDRMKFAQGAAELGELGALVHAELGVTHSYSTNAFEAARTLSNMFESAACDTLILRAEQWEAILRLRVAACLAAPEATPETASGARKPYAKAMQQLVEASQCLAELLIKEQLEEEAEAMARHAVMAAQALVAAAATATIEEPHVRRRDLLTHAMILKVTAMQSLRTALRALQSEQRLCSSSTTQQEWRESYEVALQEFEAVLAARVDLPRDGMPEYELESERRLCETLRGQREGVVLDLALVQLQMGKREEAQAKLQQLIDAESLLVRARAMVVHATAMLGEVQAEHNGGGDAMAGRLALPEAEQMQDGGGDAMAGRLVPPGAEQMQDGGGDAMAGRLALEQQCLTAAETLLGRASTLFSGMLHDSLPFRSFSTGWPLSWDELFDCLLKHERALTDLGLEEAACSVRAKREEVFEGWYGQSDSDGSDDEGSAEEEEEEIEHEDH